MSDSDIQVSPDSTGKLVDTSQVTTDAGTVQRQRVAIGDASAGEQVAGVNGDGQLAVAIPTGTPTLNQAKVATGGTAEQLTVTSTPLNQGIVVKALATNTDLVAVGPVGVTDATDGTGDGWVLSPGECSPVLPYSNADAVWINSATSGVGVCWAAI